MFGQIASIAAALGTGIGWTSGLLEKQIHQVAIVGAGPGGSSAAYYVRKYAEEAEIPVNITIFEKDGRIGGRTLTVPAYGDGELVELGASIFIELNHILFNATQEFGLNATKPNPGDDIDRGLGIWDGDEFVFTMKERDSWWWNIGRLFWKYGIAPYRTQKLMESTIASFLEIYNRPNFPFKSLTETAMNLGLTAFTGVTGAQLLQLNNIGEKYSHDIVQASTRVNYASNLDYIHGLDAMVAMAPEGAMQIQGGNWQIFDRMVNKSGAYINLQTPVSGIFHSKKGYSLEIQCEQKDEKYPILFDDVVIATPFQYSKIDIQEGILEQPLDEIPYADLAVTLFTSPLQFDPAFFNLPSNSELPSTILSTLAKSDVSASFPEGVGKPGFYSISTLRNTTNPQTQQQEWIYKIFSPQPVTPDFLSALLGAKVPDSFTGTHPEEPDLVPISWYYPHVFHAYPIAYPRVTFQDPILAPGLYYTSGMESFISTMETNSLSGMNIAKLIVEAMVAQGSVVPKNPNESEKVISQSQAGTLNQEL